MIIPQDCFRLRGLAGLKNARMCSREAEGDLKSRLKVRPYPGQPRAIERFLLSFLGVLLRARGFCNAGDGLLGACLPVGMALFHALCKAFNASPGVYEVLAAGIKWVAV